MHLTHDLSGPYQTTPHRYFCGMVEPPAVGDRAVMSKRILAGVLWLFAGWYIGNIVAFYLGISDLLGPILGVASALVIAGDPLRIVWSGTGRSTSAQGSPATSD